MQSYNNLLLFSISGIINFLGAFSLALLVIFRNPHSKINIRCGLANLSFAMWSFGYIFWPIAETYSGTMLWFRILHCGAVFIPITLFHFITTFLQLELKRLIKTGYVISILFLPIIFTKYFISGMRPIGIFPYWGIPELAYIAYLIYFYTYAILSTYYLISSYKHASKLLKNQIRYLLIGIVCGYISGSSNYLLFFRVSLPPYLNLFAILYVICFTYAILAHRLIDLRIIIRKTLVYSILGTIITLLYFFVIIVIELIFRNYYGYHSPYLTIAIILLFTIVLQPVKIKVQKTVDKYYFHNTIDQIDEENIRLRGELQKSEKLKAVSTLAAGMAHEIKNPLTAIKTFAEYLPVKGDNPEFRDKFSGIVITEVERINNIVKQLLEFSKPKELVPVPTDMNALIEETLSLLNNEMIKKDIRAIKELSPLPMVNIDPPQMKQALLNLLLNAIDAMKSGGTLTVRTRIFDSKISISIEDTGCGIDKKDLKNIFDPFFTRKDEGSGLGLSVVHGIIDKHNGKIDVKSTLGTGTTFTLTI
ncbi:MAG: ATP-binding protein [Patescibacteria group bacterium]|nr:ATP-binding protein [Patescibacteria group bacterium]